MEIQGISGAMQRYFRGTQEHCERQVDFREFQEVSGILGSFQGHFRAVQGASGDFRGFGSILGAFLNVSECLRAIFSGFRGFSRPFQRRSKGSKGLSGRFMGSQEISGSQRGGFKELSDAALGLPKFP